MNKEFITKIAEFVGSNVSLDINKYMGDLEPFIKYYSLTYRIWEEGDNPKELIKTSAYISTTKDIEAIEEMIQENDFEDFFITEQSGEGFEPMVILKKGLKAFPDHEDRDFILDVIDRYAYQKEVVLTKIFKINFENL